MKDLRVVLSKAALRITSVAPVRGFLPPAIIILGEKFNTANEVVYNGIEVKEFLIASPHRIVARIPDSQIGKALTDLRVLAPVQVSKTDAIVTFGLSKPIRAVDGMDRLIQEFLLIFYSSPGSDLFDQTAGGGGKKIIGRNGYAADGHGAVAELSLAVDRSKQELMRKQSKNSKIPPSERLLSASLSDVKFDTLTTTLFGTIALRNVLGASANVDVR